MAKPAKTSRALPNRENRREVPRDVLEQDARVIDMLALPEKISFAGALADVFTPPEFLTLQKPDDRLPGPVIYAMHIRGYFHKAIARLEDQGMRINEAHSK